MESVTTGREMLAAIAAKLAMTRLALSPCSLTGTAAALRRSQGMLIFFHALGQGQTQVGAEIQTAPLRQFLCLSAKVRVNSQIDAIARLVVLLGGHHRHQHIKGGRHNPYSSDTVYRTQRYKYIGQVYVLKMANVQIFSEKRD